MQTAKENMFENLETDVDKDEEQASLELKETQQAEERNDRKVHGNTSHRDYLFWSRFHSLPLIQDSLDTLTYYTNGNISRRAVQQVQANFRRVVQTAEPFKGYYEPLLQQTDVYCCQSLDRVENTFPIVRRPTAELVKSIRQLPSHTYQHLVKSTENVLDRVQAPAVTRMQMLLDNWLPAEKEVQRQEAMGHVPPPASLLQLSHKLSDRLSLWFHRHLNSSFPAALVEKTTAPLNNPHNFVNGYINGMAATTIHMADATTEFIVKRVSMPVFMHRWDPLWKQVEQEYSLIREETLKSDVAPIQKVSTLIQSHAARFRK